MHHCHVKQPPPWLPSADSRVWHNRRWWDQLGYLRVRTLSNPAAVRDPDRLIRFLRSERSLVLSRVDGRQFLDEAIQVAQRYKGLRQLAGEGSEDFAQRLDLEWDCLLAAIDNFLELRQQEHLRRVDEAGASGRE